MLDFKHFNRYDTDTFIGVDKDIHVERHSSMESKLHWHNYFEIEIILSGRGKHILNGYEQTFYSGYSYITTPTDYHKLKCDVPTQLINISFTEKMLTEKNLSAIIFSKNNNSQHLTEEKLHLVTLAAELLEHECKVDGPCKMQLFEYILSYLLNTNTDSLKDIDLKHLTGIRKAVLYLELHFREDISLSTLAELSGFNPTYFSELFKEVIGECYSERLTNLRLGHVLFLLSNGFSVTEACFSAGFGSLSNFHATFKKKYGMTPGAYRKKHYKQPK